MESYEDEIPRYTPPPPPDARSPQITRVTWGRLEVEGDRIFKDAKLYPGGARPWDWNETGTSHIPGVQPADVQEILDRGVEVLVIGRGYLGHLQVCPETRALLQERKVELHVLQTEVAVALYNKLRRTRHVGGIFHSTC